MTYVDEEKGKYTDEPAGKPRGGSAVLNWVGTGLNRAASEYLSLGRSQSDANRALGEWAGKQFNMSDEDKKKFGEYTARFLPSLNPAAAVSPYQPTTEQVQKAVEKDTGLKETNLGDTHGGAGKLADAARDAVADAVITPFGGTKALIRSLLPAASGGILGEFVGESTKGTVLETPGRFLGGLLGSLGGGVGTGVLAKTGTGVSNLVSWRDAKKVADDLWARALNRDKMSMDDQTVKMPGGETVTTPGLATQHAGALPGTPVGAVAGPSIMNVLRGTHATPGEGSSHIADAARRFRESEGGRVGPIVNQVSTLSPTDVRAAELRTQAGTDAPPIYRSAGIPDDPQAILTQKPGPQVPVESKILGPDGKPIVTMKEGPPVTEVTTNSKMITGKDAGGNDTGLTTFLNDSGYMKSAIAEAKKESRFKNMPDNSMAVLDKAYHKLSGQASEAWDQKNFERHRTIKAEQTKLADIIAKENPTYGAALKAYSDPQSLASAGELGLKLIGGDISAEMFGKTFQGLGPDQQREFLGGVATFLRERGKSSDRGSLAGRIWNAEEIREKLAQLPVLDKEGLPGKFGTDPPANLREAMDAKLRGEIDASRRLGDITGNSSTANKQQAIKETDTAVREGTGLVHDVATRGPVGAIVNGLLGWGGKKVDRIVEGRTEAVNKELAQRGMETDPSVVRQTMKDVEAARARARKSEREKLAGWVRGVTGGLLGSQ